MKAGQQAATLWNTGQKAWTSARSWLKGWSGNGNTSEAGPSTSEVEHEIKGREPVDVPPVPEDEEKEHIAPQKSQQGDEGEEPRKPLWGPCACCISCVSEVSQITST